VADPGTCPRRVPRPAGLRRHARQDRRHATTPTVPLSSASRRRGGDQGANALKWADLPPQSRQPRDCLHPAADSVCPGKYKCHCGPAPRPDRTSNKANPRLRLRERSARYIHSSRLPCWPRLDAISGRSAVRHQRGRHRARRHPNRMARHRGRQAQEASSGSPYAIQADAMALRSHRPAVLLPHAHRRRHRQGHHRTTPQDPLPRRGRRPAHRLHARRLARPRVRCPHAPGNWRAALITGTGQTFPDARHQMLPAATGLRWEPAGGGWLRYRTERAR
jgi:hypothetical protein